MCPETSWVWKSVTSGSFFQTLQLLSGCGEQPNERARCGCDAHWTLDTKLLCYPHLQRRTDGKEWWEQKRQETCLFFITGKVSKTRDHMAVPREWWLRSLLGWCPESWGGTQKGGVWYAKHVSKHMLQGASLQRFPTIGQFSVFPFAIAVMPAEVYTWRSLRGPNFQKLHFVVPFCGGKENVTEVLNWRG